MALARIPSKRRGTGPWREDGRPTRSPERRRPPSTRGHGGPRAPARAGVSRSRTIPRPSPVQCSARECLPVIERSRRTPADDRMMPALATPSEPRSRKDSSAKEIVGWGNEVETPPGWLEQRPLGPLIPKEWSRWTTGRPSIRSTSPPIRVTVMETLPRRPSAATTRSGAEASDASSRAERVPWCSTVGVATGASSRG